MSNDESTQELEELFPLLYSELRRIASAHMDWEDPAHTLQPTALVHEAYLRLSAAGPLEVRSKQHFLALASRAIRRILVDHARRRGRQRRGGGQPRPVLLLESMIQSPGGEATPIDLLALEESLIELEGLNQRHARIIELRFFAGLTNAETAGELGLTERSIERDWRGIKLWLASKLG